MNKSTKPLYIGSACLVLFVLLAFTLQLYVVERFDLFMLEAAMSIRAGWVTVIMEWFAFIGSSEAVVVLTVIVFIGLFIIKAPWRDFFFLGTIMAATAVFNTTLKYTIARVRPEDFMMIELTTYSFPSGHSMGALSLYGALVFLLWERIPSGALRVMMLSLAIVIILVMGSSRVYLGVHYATDIMGGFLMSGAIIAFTYWFFYGRKQQV